MAETFRVCQKWFIKVLITCLITLAYLPHKSDGRIHRLYLTNDIRRYFSISNFGFFEGGSMEIVVNEISFNSEPKSPNAKFGFSLTRTISNSVTPYLESHQDMCLLLDDSLGNDENVNIISFIVDLDHERLVVNCSKNFNLELSSEPSQEGSEEKELGKSQRKLRNIGRMTSDTSLMVRKRSAIPKEDNVGTEIAESPEKPKTVIVAAPKKLNEAKNSKLPDEKKEPAMPEEETKSSKENFQSCSSVNIPVKIKKVNGAKSYSFRFNAKVTNQEQSGLYSLYFHNCANYGTSVTSPIALNLTMNIIEHNKETYLSAGEIPLPQLFFIMSVTFFCLGCGWIYVLKRKSQETFKIHYLMGLLVFVKSLSLLFHGINYYFIARDGLHVEAWAIMYYITHLLKGALLFITIVLIGTGWAFIKHILSDKDKKIFMIVIPLQVLANVAEIIMEESEEGETQHNTWREVFVLVDLLCCGAILFPVVWSIRHLQDASHTDGKAAINLEKLKLFRHFYVMIVCYIYFTRIIVFLLKITVPFQYEWLDEFFREVATLVFFLVTGYKFRPTYNNPYFRLSTEEDLVEMEEVMTQSGLTEQVHKTRRSISAQKQGVGGKQESSHEYD